jgi:hyperosmotically inducible periplasmic protein
MKRHELSVLALVAGLCLLTSGAVWSQDGNGMGNGMSKGQGAMQHPPSQKGEERLIKEVHHELVMLPYYGVFDNLAYKVDGNTVTLVGQVTRPTLKSDAESAVKHIEGVESVNNQIEVLPVSPNDDRIRMAEYRAIYGDAPLDRYAMQAIPPIHIMVKNGNVTLVGVVANDMDKNTALIRAKTVPGVFSVNDELKIGA